MLFAVGLYSLLRRAQIAEPPPVSVVYILVHYYIGCVFFYHTELLRAQNGRRTICRGGAGRSVLINMKPAFDCFPSSLLLGALCSARCCLPPPLWSPPPAIRARSKPAAAVNSKHDELLDDGRLRCATAVNQPVSSSSSSSVPIHRFGGKLHVHGAESILPAAMKGRIIRKAQPATYITCFSAMMPIWECSPSIHPLISH